MSQKLVGEELSIVQKALLKTVINQNKAGFDTQENKTIRPQ